MGKARKRAFFPEEPDVLPLANDQQDRIMEELVLCPSSDRIFSGEALYLFDQICT
jgi:hypothetical protein